MENKEIIVTNEELLTLTASDAVEYGIARAQVKDLAGVLDFLAKRDGVTFTGETMVLETTWSEEMVRWVNSPAVMAVLVMLALLGVYIEFNSPGVGLPGLVAVICLAIIIGSKYLHGMANWIEVALFVIGILLLMIEIFVLPGFGIAGFIGIICILAGLFGMLVRNPPDKLPWPQDTPAWHDGGRNSSAYVWLARRSRTRSRYLSPVHHHGNHGSNDRFGRILPSPHQKRRKHHPRSRSIDDTNNR